MLRRQPSGEMLGNLRVGLHAEERMPTSVKMDGKLLKNYAEMAGGHPAAHEGAPKNAIDHASLANTLVFEASPLSLLHHSFKIGRKKLRPGSDLHITDNCG